ncbi:MAG: sphingomyelin phosphodiesterase [Paludibacter sp.]|nr:sphingomyelin phosphodiesterase [Paludibacter sp.]
MIQHIPSIKSELQPQEIQNTDPGSLKILSWNIYMLPYLSLFNHNAGRARAIADRLEHSEYNIIVFQEAFSSKCRNILARQLAREFPFQYGPANKNHWPFISSSGLWVVSKFPLVQIDSITFSNSKGLDMLARKGAVLFQGDFLGAKFQLLTTHLQAYNSQHIREKQCTEIKEHLLNRYFNPDIPQLICGDFNIDMDDHINYQLMLHTLGSRNGEISGKMKFTYDEIDNTLIGNVLGKKRVIDYFLVRNEKWIKHIERKVQTFKTRIGTKSAHLSDHYALEAEIKFHPTILNDTMLLSAVK